MSINLIAHNIFNRPEIAFRVKTSQSPGTLNKQARRLLAVPGKIRCRRSVKLVESGTSRDNADSRSFHEGTPIWSTLAGTSSVHRYSRIESEVDRAFGEHSAIRGHVRTLSSRPSLMVIADRHGLSTVVPVAPLRLKPRTSISRDREPVLRVLMWLPGLARRGLLILVRVDFGRKLLFRLASKSFYSNGPYTLPICFPTCPINE